MTGTAWLAICVAGVVSLTSPFVLRPLLERGGVFDVPNQRSSHVHATLRGGGTAVLLGLISGSTVLLLTTPRSDDRLLVMTIVLCAVAAAIVGLVEDVRGIPVVARAALQVLIGVVTAGVLTAILGGPYWVVPVAAVFIAAYVNVANFMDGVNAISSLHGLVVGIAFAAIGVLTGTGWLGAIGGLIAAAFIAFLPWNLVGSGMFLGDVGSYLLGGSIGAVAVAAALSGVSPIAIVGPLAIYLVDAGVTLGRRMARGARWYDAHREHAYQRLNDAGLSHISVAIVVPLFTVLSTAVGLLALLDGWAWSLAASAGVTAIAAAYLLLPRTLSAAKALTTNATIPDEGPAPHRALPDHARWAVIGASGFVGRAIVAELRSAGLHVVEVTAPRLELDGATADTDLVLEKVFAPDAQEPLSSLASHVAAADIVVNASGLATPDAAATSQLYGANALLPAVIVAAAARGNAKRVLHLSSAAVQGRRPVLDATTDVSPFSPYSRSKALGEQAVRATAADLAHRTDAAPEVVIVRATSVQGYGRATTRTLRRFAGSAMASVASPGTQPTVVSSVESLARLVRLLGNHPDALPHIVIQPWEGGTVSSVLTMAGGKEPRRLPGWMCAAAVTAARSVGVAIPRVAGIARRMELLWFGQLQADPPESLRALCETAVAGGADLSRALGTEGDT